MNNRTLFIVLIALLAVYGLTRLLSNKKETTFQAELIEVDTSAVTSVTIDPKGEAPSFNLQKEGEQWIATQGRLSVKADPRAISSLLQNLTAVKARQIVAKSEDKWEEYEVQDSAGTHIQVYTDGEPAGDFIIGRFDFNQQARSATSYIRPSGQKVVYAVDGLQLISLNQGFDSYRNKSLIRMKRDMELTAFEYQYPDTTLVFEKSAEGWKVGEQLLDSMAVENYLNLLRNISGNEPADDFDELQASEYPRQELILRGNNIPGPFQVTVYRDTTREKPFIIRSNYNPDTYFLSDSTGLYQQLFKPLSAFQ